MNINRLLKQKALPGGKSADIYLNGGVLPRNGAQRHFHLLSTDAP